MEVNRIYYTERVTGRKPFIVPSQPGIATEKTAGGYRRPPRLAFAEAQVRALAMVRVGQERAVGSPHGLVEMPLEIILRPSAVGERPSVFRAHDQHRMGVQREVLAVPEARHRPAHRSAELAGGSARMIRDSMRRIAGEQDDGRCGGRQSRSTSREG
jgi:hypothetical protein